MSNSYRIRTQVGVDKSIKVHLTQDFEFLEILSIKILESDIYTRQCSDYGVVIGRISINNGFGIPNCKVSIFVPLSNIDATNPIISDLYPYSSVSDLNDLGYRYNLLPYVKSYSNHVPTGSFFDKEDVLLNQSYIEVFDKYYRYTAVTNESGDFMIFGVPLGTQTLHVDVDLSDIGEFSLAPQDLVRTGLATETQVAGTKFRSSSNLNELPQIISINRIITVEPLWGQPDVCNIGINRTDFDLSAEANVVIQPTAIFMGSLFSSNDDQFQKRNCKPKVKQGELCNLVAGPGEILAIRQTIQQDTQGRPILEQFDLDSGGQVIDDNGTWLIDLPMNLDYVTTNEFGERILSDDPKVGIPTKGKYRFKIKWNQSPDLSEPIKRGYFLVPNIREYGWNSSGTNDPLTSLSATIINKTNALKSYAFSLDWNDYVDPQTAIDCEDTFYSFSYNKVYTVSQLIDQYRRGFLPNRIIAIRNILDESCESENVKFPTNDAVYRFDLLYLLFIITLFILKPVLYIILVITHLLAWVMKKFGRPEWRKLANIPLPNLTYPDCDLCECTIGRNARGGGPTDEELGASLSFTSTAYLTPFTQFTNYTSIWEDVTTANQVIITDTSENYDQRQQFAIQQLFAGNALQSVQIPNSLAPQLEQWNEGNPTIKIFTNSLTISERLNLFNTKAKYFNPSITFNGNSLPNPGGGYNRIKVKFNPSINPGSTSYHLDNVLVLCVTPDRLSELTPGKILCFQDPELSGDPNISGQSATNQFNTFSITGESVTSQLGTQRTITYANPNGTGNLNVTYNTTQSSNGQDYKFPIDIEYFQVITAMTIQNYINLSNPLGSVLKDRILDNYTVANTIRQSNRNFQDTYFFYPLRSFDNWENQVIVFLVRGVDPYSTRTEVEYDLSLLFGYSNFNQNNPMPSTTTTRKVIGNNYKLNIPIQGTIRSTKHTTTVLTGTIYNPTGIDLSTNSYLYHKSYNFIPDKTKFTDFISNLPIYYSSLDERTPFNYLVGYGGTGGGLSQAVAVQITQTSSTFVVPFRLRLDYFDYNQNPCTSYNGSNGFIVEFWRSTDSNDSNVCNSNNRKPVLNSITPPLQQRPASWRPRGRGYYPGEIVEGGSVMGQEICTADACDDLRALAKYYAPTYRNITFFYDSNPLTGFGQDGRQIIMRSDRLPTSTSTLENLSNSFALHANVRFSVYTVDDTGVFENSGGALADNPTFGSTNEVSENNPSGLSVLDTFGCTNMVPLNCYTSVGNEITVKPETNICYENGIDGQTIMENGCYYLVTVPFRSLANDIRLLTEWTARLQITFAACRNIWSHIFTNNWVNGSLYAFSFKNERFFNINNEPISDYCKDTIVLDSTNNFYYRSSPFYSGSTLTPEIKFVGAPRPIASIGGNYGGNLKNLKFPTTIVDLGPRNDFLQELTLSNEFNGYIMGKIKDTSFQDVSEILNLLIINRLTNVTFLQGLVGGSGANISTYFDRRSKSFVDGDYAQMISISSELGVVEFETSNYLPIGGPSDQDPIYFANPNSSDPVFGIFFSSDTQTRDLLSPKRIIINPLVQADDSCAFDNLNVYSQIVPFYQWEIKRSRESNYDSIFGSQSNDWFTSPIDPATGFFKKRYQSLDRLDILSRYFRTNSSIFNKDFKGYIYSIDSNGNLNPDRQSWAQNSPTDLSITVGAPYYFYFGLKKGKTAWDRFAKKWINFENIR